MNEPEFQESATHQQATLLPWYLADTLDHDERMDVEAHLSQCHTCQMELDEMKRLRTAMQAAVKEREGPSPRVLTQVMSRIRADAVSEAGTEIPVPRKTAGLGAMIADWLQSLFALPWVPVVATLLIVGQSALLLTNLSEGPSPRDQGPVIQRGIPQASAPSESSRLDIVFVDGATLGQIQALLHQIQAQIVSGPSRDGSYTVEIPTKDPAKIRAILQTLRNESAAIRSASAAIP